MYFWTQKGNEGARHFPLVFTIYEPTDHFHHYIVHYLSRPLYNFLSTFSPDGQNLEISVLYIRCLV